MFRTFSTITLIAALTLIALLVPAPMAVYVLLVASIFSLLLARFCYVQWGNPGADSLFPSDIALPGTVVDPWEMQRELMSASDQPLPQCPSLSKNSVMYAALILEEAGETIVQGLLPALDRFILQQSNAGDAHALRIIRRRFLVGQQMLLESKIIRSHLADLPEFRMALTRAEARPVLDGTTDLAVVNCGFALASGLPGAEGYLEVADSNLSKRNPATGMIDKHPDGKWIKGANYRAPDLDGVLSEAAG